MSWSAPARGCAGTALMASTRGGIAGGGAVAGGAAQHACPGTAGEPFEPTAGRAASLLVNVPALIALHRCQLAELRGDAEAGAALASAALAEAAERRLAADLQRPGASGHGRVAPRPP